MLLDISINTPLSAETNQQSEDLQSVERLQGKFDRTAINFNSSKGLSKITLWAKFKLKPNLFTKEIPSEGDAAQKKKRFPVSKPFIWYIFGIFWCWIQNAGTQNETPMQIYALLFTRPVKGIDQLMAIKGGKTQASRFHKKIQFETDSLL